MTDNMLIGAIIGGGISGAVGIFLAWYTIRLKDNQWMKENIYNKLYVWLSVRLTDFQFNDNPVYSSQLESILNPYEHLRLSKKIKKQFDACISEGKHWDKIWAQIQNRFCRKDTGIFDHFIKSLKDSNIINPNGYIIDLINSDSFLTQFLFVFINPSINNAETLYQKMKEYAEKKNISELQHLEEIKKKRAEFFDLIYDNLSTLRGAVLSDIKFEELMNKGDNTRRMLSELKESLRKKLR